ncbi:MAG: alpha/beta hydrolase family protein [Armatimonadota bacterium]
MNITVTPAATGRQLVRVSLPLLPGFLPAGKALVAQAAGKDLPTAARVLTWHPAGAPRSARRAMATWVYDFADLQPVEFTLEARDEGTALPLRLPVAWAMQDGEITITWEGGPIFKARLIAPATTAPAEREVVESNGLYHWERIVIPDPQFPRVVELRADALGQVVLVAHVQRNLPGNDYALDLGWALDCRHLKSQLAPVDAEMLVDGESVHRFETGESCEYLLEQPQYVVYHPAAPFRRKGGITIRRGVNDRTAYRCLRSEAGDATPWQHSAWQRFEMVMAPAELARLTPTLACPHAFSVDWRNWDALYGIGEPVELAGSVACHHNLMLNCAKVGDDWGNIISYSEITREAGNYAMNRLNHCPPIFFEGWRTGDRRLTEAGVLWCENFHDLTIWWGPQYTGGTRYNWGPAVDHHIPEGDTSGFCWRSNRTVDFCTKGYDTFFLAYEETGDPRMLQALQAQVTLAGELVHADRGECRNIGDVRDFIRLYHYTGERWYLDHALRLFRELTSRLWPNGLFDQAGKPETPVLPFIDNDADGIPHGYTKAYIMGYALAGLPELLRECPDEPRLRQVVQAVADFLVDAQDPSGGWRYPHPRSSGLGFGLEHAWQIVQADRALGPQQAHLDAVEKALRARIVGWQRAGLTLCSVTSWERATGALPPGKTLQDLYAHPEDRDFTRDYDEGDIGLGTVVPDGTVYFPEVLAFYLRHRPAERLLALQEDEPLARILRRLPDPKSYGTEGVHDYLPAFRDAAVKRMTYPLSWLSGKYADFTIWRKEARAKVRECLLTPPPPAAFSPLVLAEEDRGTYTAQKVAFNLTGDSRVLAYLLIPKGDGPFPGALLLHDHGARFDIGKEKVIRPFDDRPERIASAGQWVGQCYGGRFIGDELARRGYLCLATDMLNWSDRGGGGYEGQQALSANLLHLGMSWAGLIAHEDQRTAEFLAGLPQVDPKRIAAVGLSVGAYRTWQVSALSDRIAAGAAICWMATIAGQMQPGVNQTGGQSCYTMVHPGLSAHLDFPDVASLACPKPMLFFNGLQDGLFDPADVQRAYDKMHAVWSSQGADDRLETRLWDVPHVFNEEMQESAFDWLGQHLERGLPIRA